MNYDPNLNDVAESLAKAKEHGVMLLALVYDRGENALLRTIATDIIGEVKSAELALEVITKASQKSQKAGE